MTEKKWSARRTTLFIVVTCGAMWGAFGYGCAAHAEVPEAQLQALNRQINRSIVRMSDQAQYGVAEKWVVAPASGRGDCEDYALTKLWALIQMGEPAANMRVLTVRVRGIRDAHAVLQVRGHVLDNLSPWLNRPEHYTVEGAMPAVSALARAGRSDLIAPTHKGEG